MKKFFLLLLSMLILLSLCACTPEEPKNAATGKYCVECGAAATHFAGTGWVKSINGNGALYFCDKCYDKWYKENSDRIVEIKPDPVFGG